MVYIGLRGAISHGLKLPHARLRGKHIFPAPPICFHWLCPSRSACAYHPPPVPRRGKPHPHGGAIMGQGFGGGLSPCGAPLPAASVSVRTPSPLPHVAPPCSPPLFNRLCPCLSACAYHPPKVPRRGIFHALMINDLAVMQRGAVCPPLHSPRVFFMVLGLRNEFSMPRR